MDLDKLQVDASIRTGWQAVDLGFLMARAWFRPLYLAGLLPQLPLALLLFALFRESPLWALAGIWWLKPFWERLPLYIASRKLFDEDAGIRASLKSLPMRDMLPWLLWRRFSMQRAFDNPVTVLEYLKGRHRRQRLRVLHGKYSDVALANQFVCFCFELLTCFGIALTIFFLTPETLGFEFRDRYDELTLTGEWLLSLSAFVAMSLTIPFHTMAGFALYLNRRIELEAWDIEISFRSLANRKRETLERSPGLLASLLLALLLGFALAGGAEASVSHDQASASKLIHEVLQGEDFGRQRSLRKWRFKRDDEDSRDEKFPQWLIDLLEGWEKDDGRPLDFRGVAAWVKLLLIALSVGLLAYLLHRYRVPLSRLASGRTRDNAPEILFGLDVTPESLPPDVPGQVLSVWEEGRYREALSLLYRASLSRLIDRFELEFRASHTEAECAALVKAQGIDSLSDYFAQLTSVWRRLAYGHQVPESRVVQDLCRGWSSELSGEPKS